MEQSTASHQEAPTRHVDWLTDLLLAILLSVAAAWWRFEVYREAGALQPLLLTQLWTLLWILSGEILLILLIPVVISALLSWLRWPRTGATALMVAVWACMVWIAADMRVHLLTGRNLSFYLPYLTQPDVGEWAGGTDEIAHAAMGLAVACGGMALLIAIYRWGVRRMLTSWPGRRRGIGWAIVITLFLSMLAGRVYLPVASAQEDSLSKALVVMHKSAALEQEQRIARSEFGVAFASAMLPILEPLHERLFDPPTLPEVTPLTQQTPPDVLLIVLESWRMDSLNPDLMPRLHALGESGTVATHHYSASNRSELGLFSLLYGSLPSLYEQTLNHSIPPLMCHVFREWGYESIYVSGLQHRQFKRMDEFIDHPDAFDEVKIFAQWAWHVEMANLNWADRDREVMKYVKSRIDRTDRKPLFAVAFLGSTHFPYRYPPEFLLHEPVSPDTEIWAGAMSRETHETRLRNRYANSAAFLDDEVGRLIDGLDLSRTIVLVTGDHGESLWDDGILTHATRPSEIQCRVPLLAVGRNIPKSRIDVPTNHLDVLPTLLNAVSGKPALGWTEGKDLLDPDLKSRPMVLTFPPPEKGPQELALFLPEGRMLVRLMNRKPVARVLGFVGKDGVVNPALTPGPRGGLSLG